VGLSQRQSLPLKESEAMAYVDELSDKFFVIKVEDVHAYLNSKDQGELVRILSKITQARHNTGKNLNDYVVINLDEPYMDKIKATMLEHGHWG
jgi:hypothetical protein